MQLCIETNKMASLCLDSWHQMWCKTIERVKTNMTSEQRRKNKEKMLSHFQEHLTMSAKKSTTFLALRTSGVQSTSLAMTTKCMKLTILLEAYNEAQLLDVSLNMTKTVMIPTATYLKIEIVFYCKEKIIDQWSVVMWAKLMPAWDNIHIHMWAWSLTCN